MIDASALTITPTASAANLTAGNLKGELSEDGKTLTVSLTGGSEYFDGTYAVEVIKDKVKLRDDASAFIDAYQGLVKVEDTTGPSITGVKYDNTKAVVTFSEALKSEGTVSLDGVQLTSGTGYTALNAGDKELEILGLTPGETYNLSVVGATDIAGNHSTPNELNVTLNPPVDTEKPVVTTSVDNTKVTFKFSKELKKQDLGSNPGNDDDYAKVTLSDGTVVYLTDAEQDANDKTKFVKDLVSNVTGDFLNTTLKVEDFQDKVGNAGEAVSTSVTLKKDTTAPKFVSAKTDGDKLIIKYDEPTKNNSLDNNDLNITFTDSEGVLHTAANPNAIGTVADEYDANGNGVIDGDEENYIVIPLTGSQFLDNGGNLKAGSYKVEVAADVIEDTAATANRTAAHTINITVTEDATAKEIVELTSADQGSNTGEIDVVFNNDMGASALEKANYKLGGNALPSGSTLTFVGDKKNVRITLPEGAITATGKRVLEVSNVKDVDGNILKPGKTKVETTNVIKENVKPTAKKVSVVDGQNLSVAFSEVLDSLPGTVNGVKVKVNGTEVALDSTTPFALSTDSKSLTIKADNANAFKNEDSITVEFDNSNIVDKAGNTVKNATINK